MGKTPDFIFFLGGHDAEMLEIRDILKSRDIPFFDKGLSWGAKLSEYRGELESLTDDQLPVFVELGLDRDYPERAINIDHHDERSGKDKPTSLEQLARLLNIQLNRRQQLIAANDRGHIEAMLELCATEAEVQEVRKLDLEAQGVTDNDQKLTRESVDDNIEKIGHTAAIINSKTTHTSIIFDMLYDKYRYIFVITPDHKLNYSGDGRMILRLKKEYEQIKKQDKDIEFWYGGNLPERGYFGANKTIEKEVIKKMVEEEIPVNPKIISHHIFMFPFTIKTINEVQDHDFLNGVTEALKETAWEKRKFKIEAEETSEGNRNLRYSEYFYFHSFVQDALYYTGDEHPVMKFFERPLGKNAKFIISLINGTRYELKLNKVSLYIFDTGVGILSMELFNDKYQGITDVLKINDYGRRIYPQYIDEKKGIGGTKESFLADSITLEFDIDNTPKITESFPLNKFRREHLNVAKYIRKLLGNKFNLPSSDNTEKALYEYRPTIDDRMYAICWFGSDKWSNILKKDDTGGYCYENSDMWYQFMYHDGGVLTCQHPTMMHELIEKSTYQRWADWGTFYGITRYSLTSITDTGDFAYNIIRQHMRRQYARMARLLLAQRASILKFSGEVTDISNYIKQKKDQKDLGEITGRVEDLHARYIHFVNRLWFTEITPQEQGIEMYTQAVEVMRLKTETEDLKTEIKELYEYIGLSYDRQSNAQVNTLTILGAVFLPLMVLTGFFGMNLAFIDPGAKKIIEKFINNSSAAQLLETGWVWWFFSLIFFASSYWIALRITKGYLIKIKMKAPKLDEIFAHLKFWIPITNFFKSFGKKRDRR